MSSHLSHRATFCCPTLPPHRIWGWPLLGYGSHPRAIVAIGAFPVGFFSVGWVSIGFFFAFGQAAAGIGISIGQAAAGSIVVGQLALGLVMGLGQLVTGAFVTGQLPLGPFNLFEWIKTGSICTSSLFGGCDPPLEIESNHAGAALPSLLTVFVACLLVLLLSHHR